jgi:peptidoglycan/xylan/chitin deacetylase (PgdA/CDA1 family)
MRPDTGQRACFSVDLEQDRAPDTTSWRGIEEGLPRLLGLLADLAIRGTFFVTGESARRFPSAIADILAAGHEVGSHGDRHLRFDRIGFEEARRDIRVSVETLSRLGARVTSFRAPYLRLPQRLLNVLADAGLRVDSSEGAHKSLSAKARLDGRLARLPASLPPAVLWWPAALRDRVLRRARRPLVLYVHPWELVDFGAAEVRRSPRYLPRSPSEKALPRLRQVLVNLQRQQGTAFVPLETLAQPWLG